MLKQQILIQKWYGRIFVIPLIKDCFDRLKYRKIQYYDK